MTTLEIILIAVMWVCYGVFTVYRTDDVRRWQTDGEDLVLALAMIVFAPIVLVGRAIIGIFKEYD